MPHSGNQIFFGAFHDLAWCPPPIWIESRGRHGRQSGHGLLGLWQVGEPSGSLFGFYKGVGSPDKMPKTIDSIPGTT